MLGEQNWALFSKNEKHFNYASYSGVIFDENLRNLIIARDLATLDVVTITTDDDLYNALDKITRKDFSILPVVSPDNPLNLMGILTRRDIISAYNKAVIKRSVFNE